MSVVRFINEINRKIITDERWTANDLRWETDGMLIDAEGFSKKIHLILHVLTIKSPNA